MEAHYRHQYQITEQFYDSLFELVQQMKEDHLQDLDAEGRKHAQEALIREDHLKAQLESIELIRNDLTSNLEGVLDDFSRPDVQESFNIYKQEMFKYKDKIED